MNNTAAIRAAGPKDLDALVPLIGTLFAIEGDFSFDADKARRGLAMLLNNGASRVFAAEAGGAVVGMCSGQLVISTAEGGPSVLVEDVVVREDWRGRGLGRMLMDAVLDWGRDQSATRLQLLADLDNGPALAFYDRLGWSPTRLTCLRTRPDGRS